MSVKDSLLSKRHLEKNDLLAESLHDIKKENHLGIEIEPTKPVMKVLQ